MKDCVCGKPVRLRAARIRVSVSGIGGRSGVAHLIEHTDGTVACGGRDMWSCVALKPYAKDEEQRPSRLLRKRWKETT